MPDPSPEAVESLCWAASMGSRTRTMLAAGVELVAGAPKELTVIAKNYWSRSQCTSFQYLEQSCYVLFSSQNEVLYL